LQVAKTLTGDLFISKSAPSIQLKAANSSVAGFILANASGTHHWSLNTDAGGAGQQGEFRIANSILGNNAIKIETNNAVTLTGGLTGTTANFTGQLTLGSTITNGTYTYTLPSATGTLALTSDLTGYLPLTGGTLTGALSGTSATFSGTIVSTVGNNGALLSATTATTGYQYIDIITTSGRTQLIQESSVAGTTVTNSTAYASMFGSAVAKDVILFTNGANRLKLDGSTGEATFSSSVTAGTGQGFMNLTYQAGYNRIWSFGSGAEAYGMGYYQGVTAPGGSDCMGFHFGNTATPLFYVNNSGAATFSSSIAATSATFSGAVSKGSGSFRIEHPLPSLSETHQLVHSFIEGPQADLIYRGRLILVNGKAQANIDEVSTMTEGTFEVLCREVQCFTTNESGWDLIKGKVIGNIIYIESQNESSADEISWMVIGERKDKHMMDTEWTDENGKVIVEPLKPIEPEPIEEVEPIVPIDNNLE
jgi:hypothetical protein